MAKIFARLDHSRMVLCTVLLAVVLVDSSRAIAQQPTALDAGNLKKKSGGRGGLPDGWKKRLAETLWFDYSPTGYNPTVKPPRQPSEDDIRQDLEVFRKLAAEAGPRAKAGVVLYGCRHGLDKVAALAHEKKLSVILGVWDPTDEEELRNAEKILRENSLAGAVAALCVGNETQTFRRCTLDQIHKAAERLQKIRSLPVTTTEIIQAYGNPDLVDDFDFCFPNIHPLFNQIRDPVEAARWTTDQVRSLQKEAPGKVLVVKECGWPSGPEPAFTEDQQARFWQAVLEDAVARQVNFCVFEASFKIDWKREWVTVDPGRLPEDKSLRSGNRVDVGRFWSVFGSSPKREPRKAMEPIMKWWNHGNHLREPGKG